ncbi:glutathione S-transferase 1-like [Calliphora vicina]|uniref:glutathione S-transferase 1-like n=1 Tax=Calliphora vicina TaxID=7373 RepID=UPI00325AF249
MPKLTLYGLDLSPPHRACVLTLKALNLPFEYKSVNFLEKQHLTEDYLKKNPQHTVPTLEDDGHFIWDSHAIITYLVSKYGKDDTLYPKDLLKRALVDQRLHFESGVVFTGSLRNITCPLIMKNETRIPQHKIDAIVETYDFLEVFLKDSPYVAGDHLTVADFSIVSTVTTLVAFVEIDSAKYPKVTAWIKRLEALPYYHEANAVGNKIFVDIIKSKNFTIVE